MRPRHVMVIDPAMHTPELDCFNRMAVGSPVPLTYHLPALHGFASITRDEAGAIGVVVLGSSSSVNDQLPWQRELGAWLLGKMEREQLPTLGLCFGHQLIAHLYDAPVAFLFPDQRKLLGFELVSLAPDRLWGNEARSELLYASHREVVTACPPQLRVTASRPSVPLDGFAHATLPIWTFQTHPEATPNFSRGEAPELAGDPARFEFGHDLVRRFLELAAK